MAPIDDAMRRTVCRRIALLGAVVLAFAPGRALAACDPTAARLCLNGSRFAVEVAWALPGSGPEAAQAVPLTADTGLFWFFSNSNLELVVKILDGRPVNGHFWVFYAGLSDVEYTITVMDTRTGAAEIYRNPRGTLASRADTSAFDAEPVTAGRVARFGAVGGLGAAASAPVPIPVRQGPEFQVNVTTPGLQDSPSVAIGPGGDFMVVWLDGSHVTSRLYDRAGVPKTGEVRLNTGILTSGSWAARVAAGSSGEFMAVWSEFDGGLRVAARILGPDGQPLGEKMRLGAGGRHQGNAAVVADPAGGFQVFWLDAGELGGSGGVVAGVRASIRWQRFDTLGRPVGEERSMAREEILLTATSDETGGFRVAAAPGGGFVLAWLEDVAYRQTSVFALRIDADGKAAGTPFLVSTDGRRLPGFHFSPVPVFHAGGGFSVVWGAQASNQPGTPGIFARKYAADGLPPGAISRLYSEAPGTRTTAAAVAPLPSGDTLLVLHGQSPADPDGGLFGQVFDEAWSPRGGNFRINTYTADGQFDPAVAVDRAGNLVAAWSSGVVPLPFEPPIGFGEGTQDGSFTGVFAQRFTTCALSSDQLCLGGRFRVEVEFTSLAGAPAAARALPLTADTGAFWFFAESNLELIVKIVDGRPVNGRYWFFVGALSDAAYTITVTDTETGQRKTYENRRGRLASRADVEAF